MTGKTHMIVGVSAAMALAAKYPNGLLFLGTMVNTAAAIISAPIGAYSPDMDMQNSKYGSKIKPISKHMTHRGITHTLLVPAITIVLYKSVATSTLLSSLIFGFFLGYILHLAADMLNRKGIPLMWPLSNSKIHIWTFKTGTFDEVIFLGIWLVGLALFYKM